jgi:hypothetical protein
MVNYIDAKYSIDYYSTNLGKYFKLGKIGL